MAPPAGLRGTLAERATEAEANAGEKGHVLKSGEDQGSRSRGTKEIPEPALWWRGKKPTEKRERLQSPMERKGRLPR